MIDTGELMQDNLVNLIGVTIKISNIFEMKNIYSPIPLTIEWLLKFGFENARPGQYRFDGRLLIIREGKIYDFATEVHLKTVHQLQNFMYANTGKKLILAK